MSGTLGAWCRNHKVNRGQNQLTMYYSCAIGLELMSGGLGVWCRKHQVNPGTKPAHNGHFLHSRVISIELMSRALGAWCRNRNVKPGQNQFSLFPGHWLGAHVHLLWGLDVQFFLSCVIGLELMNVYCIHSRVIGGSSCHML